MGSWKIHCMYWEILELKKIFLGFAMFFLLFSVAAVSADRSYSHYSIACPFKTITDSVTEDELSCLSTSETAGCSHKEIAEIQFPPELSAQFKNAAVYHGVPEELIYIDGYNKKHCAIVKTAALRPDWKRIAIAELPAVWDKDYDPLQDILAFPSDADDYDRAKSTTLLLTGTTALARTTAYKIYLNGYEYAGELIKEVFDNADLRHVSNESSFWSLCPDPINTNGTMQFCTPYEDWHLLEYLGVNAVELTGNHLRDYDWKPLVETLDLLNEQSIAYYGAGYTAADADETLIVEHHGNKFAFVGCNSAGPEHVFATEDKPGTYLCDYPKLREEIGKLKDAGYIVIMTFQYFETYSRTPTAQQAVDFERAHDFGATVVSGSQAHYAQTFKPYKDSFIAYGPGNLFFDQMELDGIGDGATKEILTRYVFYDGRLLQAELITARLTDYCRPRLMVQWEREEFLSELFSKM